MMLLLLVLVVGADTASAATRKVLVTRIRTYDDRSLLDADRLTAVVIDAMKSNTSLEVLVDSGEDCAELECLHRKGVEAGADVVLDGVAQRIGRNVDLRFRVIQVSDNTLLTTLERSVLGAQESLVEGLQAMTAQMSDRILSQNGVIIVNTSPPACTVMLNGEPAGFAPVTFVKPGGFKYRVSAGRSGFTSVEQNVFLAEGDTLVVSLVLSRPFKRVTGLKNTTPTHVYGSLGVPIIEGVTNYDQRAVFGFSAQMGEFWRLTMGFNSYKRSIAGTDTAALAEMSAAVDPVGSVYTPYVMLISAPLTGSVTPIFGIGGYVSTTSVAVEFTDQSTSKINRELELGWVVMIGAEIPIHNRLSMQINWFTQQLISSDSEWENVDYGKQAWVDAFNAMERNSSLCISLGLKF